MERTWGARGREEVRAGQVGIFRFQRSRRESAFDGENSDRDNCGIEEGAGEKGI